MKSSKSTDVFLLNAQRWNNKHFNIQLQSGLSKHAKPLCILYVYKWFCIQTWGCWKLGLFRLYLFRTWTESQFQLDQIKRWFNRSIKSNYVQSSGNNTLWGRADDDANTKLKKTKIMKAELTRTKIIKILRIYWSNREVLHFSIFVFHSIFYSILSIPKAKIKQCFN